MIGLDTTFLVQVAIREADGHEAALALLRREIVGRDRRAALAPQVLSEFVHVATDPRRFERPLSIAQALAKAGFWWNAAEVERITPDDQVVSQFLAWMQEHDLGRKRLLDTMLAATYYRSGVTRIVTSNARDYRVFGVFELTEI
ncbi:MAG: PIN domain-containing protein [Acidobacteria bacterium]|nr:PIN domain-containing protein [Acidobacteriota bacterium]